MQWVIPAYAARRHCSPTLLTFLHWKPKSLCCGWVIWPIQKGAKTLKIYAMWVLLYTYSARVIQWIPTWQGLDGFKKYLRHCALDKSRLSFRRVNLYWVLICTCAMAFLWKKAKIIMTFQVFSPFYTVGISDIRLKIPGYSYKMCMFVFVWW